MLQFLLSDVLELHGDDGVVYILLDIQSEGVDLRQGDFDFFRFFDHRDVQLGNVSFGSLRGFLGDGRGLVDDLVSNDELVPDLFEALADGSRQSVRLIAGFANRIGQLHEHFPVPAGLAGGYGRVEGQPSDVN